MSGRILKGKVVSTKMEKTIVVMVEIAKIHPKYNKRYTMTRKYKAHYEGDAIKEGDAVSIIEVPKFSKSKSWVVQTNKANKKSTEKAPAKTKKTEVKK